MCTDDVEESEHFLSAVHLMAITKRVERGNGFRALRPNMLGLFTTHDEITNFKDLDRRIKIQVQRIQKKDESLIGWN